MDRSIKLQTGRVLGAAVLMLVGVVAAPGQAVDIATLKLTIPAGYEFAGDNHGMQQYADYMDCTGNSQPDLVLRDDVGLSFRALEPANGYSEVWSYIADPEAVCSTCDVVVFHFQGFYRITMGQFHAAFVYEAYDFDDEMTYQTGVQLVSVGSGTVDQQLDDYSFQGAIGYSTNGGLGFLADLLLLNRSQDVIEIWGSGGAVGVPEFSAAALRLDQNYPNPFNPSTVLSFTIETTTSASIEIHDMRGRLVLTDELGILPPGEHQFTWRGTDGDGRHVAAGTYFYSVVADGQRRSRKMALIK